MLQVKASGRDYTTYVDKIKDQLANPCVKECKGGLECIKQYGVDADVFCIMGCVATTPGSAAEKNEECTKEGTRCDKYFIQFR